MVTMTKTLLPIVVLSSCLLLGACKQNQTEATNSSSAPSAQAALADATASQAASAAANSSSQAAQTSAPAAFSIESIPLASNFQGTFPYFKLPEGYKFADPYASGSGKTKEFDREYFYNHGVYLPVDGKSFKASIRPDEAAGKAFSKIEIQKSFDDLIASLGGVKLNSGGKLKEGETKRLEAEAPNAYADGYLNSCHNYEDVHTYVIRSPEKTVWVQYNLGDNQAWLTVLEAKAFENKMGIIPTSGEMQKQLDEKGKAVLYINFDTDKATLKDDGKQVVSEIAKLLANNTNLKLSIQGHTDNTGNATHNQQLSQNRAESVAKELASMGIASARLQSKGFGQDKPIADNSTEDGKAKNRRVELVKLD